MTPKDNEVVKMSLSEGIGRILSTKKWYRQVWRLILSSTANCWTIWRHIAAAIEKKRRELINKIRRWLPHTSLMAIQKLTELSEKWENTIDQNGTWSESKKSCLHLKKKKKQQIIFDQPNILFEPMLYAMCVQIWDP